MGDHDVFVSHLFSFLVIIIAQSFSKLTGGDDETFVSDSWDLTLNTDKGISQHIIIRNISSRYNQKVNYISENLLSA